jgi:glycosyltransferase involved in cell wall biosynthesis
MTMPAILHIDTGRMFRGGQRQLLLLSRRLHAMGAAQTVVVPRGSELASRIRDIPILEISTSALSRVFRLSRLKEIIVSRNINIIHANDSHAHTLGILLKRWRPDLRLIVSRRVIFPPKTSASRKLKYGRGVDCFIAISSAVKSSLTANGVSPENVEVIPSGLDVDKIRSAEADIEFVSAILPGCSVVIVSAGALTEEKDMSTAVRAFATVAGESNEAGMIILGEGPERVQLERLKEKLGLDRLVLAGHREPLAPIFKASHIFLLTSTSEGLNTSAIEAAACGLPLVVSNVGGLPEIAEQENNGLLCPPGNPERFAAAIVELIRDGERRNRMAVRSIEKAARFDIAATTEKTMALYKRVLAG